MRIVRATPWPPPGGCYGGGVPAKIIVDEGVTGARRPQVEAVVRSALDGLPEAEDLVAVVTKLPSGRLTVFVNHVADPAFVRTIEDALARLT